MKTDALVDLLASGTGSADAKLPQRRFGVAIAAGVLGASALMVGVFGVRDDLVDAAGDAMFWVKLAYAALLALASGLAALRLSRPGRPLGRSPAAIALTLAAMWIFAAVVLIGAEPARRIALVLGETWKTCPFNITLLSVPVFIALFWAMKGLAPTRLRLAGATTGFAAGAFAALVYTLHCPELEAPFLGTWYVLGMLIPAAAGALLAPRLLRW